ncbi:MAG: HEAT repeat domain-containing protein, partial [Desulfosarcina sp.]
DAGKLLLNILTNGQSDASDRLLAAELAGDFTVICEELVEALQSILHSDHESEELRSQAAISLGPVLDYADTEEFEEPDDVPISERTFHHIQESLHRLYRDAAVPKNVRRRILEASVRASQEWHRDAIRAAYSSDDEDWRLTAVFSMRYVRGFDKQILEALESDNPDIHYQAVVAAGNWEIDAAWPHVSRLLSAPAADKDLLLAAIEAVAFIRPQEAGIILVDLMDSDDEDIVEAVHEAVAIAEGLLSYGFDGDDDEDE